MLNLYLITRIKKLLRIFYTIATKAPLFTSEHIIGTIKVDKQLELNLIKDCIGGDGKAQKRLYDQYSKSMFGICLRYSNCYDDAKDILQDGFIKIFTKMSQFNSTGSFEGWMKRIFVNTALEHYRANKNHQNQEDVELAYNNVHHDFTLEKISQKEILVVLNKMSAGYRNVLNLFIIEGYSHAEIAEMLGISEGTSKSQLSRARVVLQNELLKVQKIIR
ncbi:MAG: sigma-70 family RNA polymerase sigma factor [Bacteroidota bacterium]